MKIIKFVRVSDGREEYYSENGPVKSIFAAKQFDDSEARKKFDSLNNKSHFKNHCNIFIQDYTKELNLCQDEFQSSIEKAKTIFANKGFKVD